MLNARLLENWKRSQAGLPSVSAEHQPGGTAERENGKRRLNA
jgi:hypothetical protein